MYTSPFSVSSKAINLISEISAQLERFAIRLEQADTIKLRKVNRIKRIGADKNGWWKVTE